MPDGYEYYTLGTDPAKFDTDGNGISDGDEDFDADSLTNFEEFKLGTSPFSADTDNDGLNDYDEVKIYGTDPLNFDTDGDKVSDGDEIILGLDPHNPMTFGYPDSEYTTTQTVTTDSKALDYANSSENPYTLSVDITAAGVADNCLFTNESGYSNSILENSAVLGVVPEFSYSEGLLVTDAVLNFNLSEKAVNKQLRTSSNSEFDGIKRFSIFRYFEDTNMLLPIDTTYNEATNTVSTNVDELGTYCLIDMEIWLKNIADIEPGDYYNNDNADTNNVAFCIDTRSINDTSAFENTKTDIKNITEAALEKYSNIKIYLYTQEFGDDFKAKNNLLISKTGLNYFTSYEQAEEALDSVKTSLIKNNFWAYDYVQASKYVIENCDNNIIAMYHFTADDRVVGSVSDAKELLQTVKTAKQKNDPERNRIFISLLLQTALTALMKIHLLIKLRTSRAGLFIQQTELK